MIAGQACRESIHKKVYIFPDVPISKVRFSDTPYKELHQDTYIHFIDMFYKNQSLVIQLPKYKLYNIDNNKLTICVDDIFFQYFINPLEEHIITSTHAHSEKWFNGKRFTMNKIIHSFISPYVKKDNQHFLTMSFNQNTLFFNRYKGLIPHKDIISNTYSDIELICLIKLANLHFLHNKFSYNLVLEQVKVFKHEYLTDYSIIDTSSEITSISDNTYTI